MPVNINALIAFEEGSLGKKRTLQLFANLIKTGQAWKLQGFYGRTAMSLIKSGHISRKGKILKKV